MFDVGVIITSYNRPTYLREALASVVNQTLRPAEILVVEDGGTEDSASIANEFENVELIWQQNAGHPAARNNGAQRLKSQLIAFLDDDDIWTPHKLEVQIQFQLQGEFDLTFSYGSEFGELTCYKQNVSLRTNVPLILPSTMIIKAQSYRRMNGFDTQLREGGELVDFYDRARANGLKIGICPDDLLKRRVHDSNISSAAARIQTRYTAALKKIIERKRNAQLTTSSLPG